MKWYFHSTIKNKNITVVPNGIDTNYFRSSLKFSINKPIRFLSVGRLDWIKGYEYAIKAIYHLIEQQYNIEYHIIGDGNYKESIIFAIKTSWFSPCISHT